MAFIGDMMMEGLAKGIDETAGEVIDSAETMTNDLNNVFDDLGADMNKVPTDFNVSSSVDTLGKSNIASGLKIELHIDNFNNYSREDITILTEEVMEVADSFVRRKGVVFGT
jgi:hypothetical protein